MSGDGFDEAVAHVKTASDPGHPLATKLRFYGLFKQATDGDADPNAGPGWFNVVARQKFDAWVACKGLSKTQARNEYVDLLVSVDPRFKFEKKKQEQPPAAAPVAAATAKSEPASGAAPARVQEEISQQRLSELASRAKESSKLTFANKIDLIGLYHQAIRGDCREDAPPRTKFEEFAEWNAWNELKGLSQKEAGERYVKTLLQLDDSLKPLVDTKPAAPTASSSSTDKKSLPTSKLERSAPQGKQPSPATASSALVARDRAASIDNTMTFITMGSCAAIFGCGIAGFLLSVLPYSALFWLAVAGAGLAGIIGAIIFYFDENGLLPFLPRIMNKVLFQMTFMEVVLDDTISRAVTDFATDVAPIVLARTEKDKLEALANMSLEKRRKYTTLGLINIAPDSFRKMILPRRMYEAMKQAAPVYRLNPEFAKGEDLGKIVNESSAGVSVEPRQDLQRELIKRLFSQGMNKKNSELIMSLVHPAALRIVGTAAAALFAVQILISESAREYLKTLIKISLFLGSLVGTGASVGLILLREHAKKTLQKLKKTEEESKEASKN